MGELHYKASAVSHQLLRAQCAYTLDAPCWTRCRTNSISSGVTYCGGRMWNLGLAATGFKETFVQATSPLLSCTIMASARSRNSCAEVLKSAVAGSSTVR